MIRKILLVVTLFILYQGVVLGQLELKGKEIIISNLNTNLPDGVLFEEGAADGPYLHFIVDIFNSSNNPMQLCPSKAEIIIEFRYLNKIYRQELFPHNFLEKKNVALETGAKVGFEAGVNVFLGTPILKSKPFDYSGLLIATLPTISLSYHEKATGINLTTYYFSSARIENDGTK